MTWSDRDLLDYLAGDAPAADARAIEAALLADPALEDRLMALDPLGAQLDGAQQIIQEPSAEQIGTWVQAPVLQPRATGFGWLHIAASVAVGVMLVSAAWFVSHTTQAPDWRAEVATYQALYSPDTIANIAFDDAAVHAQISDLAERINFNNLAKVTDTIDDMQLLRGQILAFDGQPLAQIVFATASGLPVALCVIEKGAGGQSAAMEIENMAGLASASFETENHSWLLIGTQDDALITRTAEQVIARLATL